jgi:predicted ATPase
VAQTLVDQLGISSADHREPAAILYQSLRHKQLLVILDNFEHLLAAASLIGDLSEAAPGLKFLVTSRQPLHIYGEQ